MTKVALAIGPAISGRISNTGDIGTPSKDIRWPPQSPLYNFSTGTDDDQLDVWFDDTRALASAAADSLDLTGTALKSAFGDNIAAAAIKVIAIKASAANTTDLVVGNDTNAFVFLGAANDTVTLKPGASLLLVDPGDGWTVTAGTGDILKITNGSGASASYDILLGGVSA